MVISMKRNDVVSLSRGLRGITVRCDDGTVWVTVAGDSADYILSAGNKITVSRRGNVVIMAEKNSAVHLFKPATVKASMRLSQSAATRNGVWQEVGSR
jgi:hypothetical protein